MKAAVHCALWLQASAAIALAIFWLAERPYGAATLVCVAAAGLATGFLMGWYGRAWRASSEAALAVIGGSVDPGLDALLCCQVWLNSAGLLAIAIVQLVTRPSDSDTAAWSANAGMAVGWLAGYYACLVADR